MKFKEPIIKVEEDKKENSFMDQEKKSLECITKKR
jgi:hypothetical protein